MMTALLISTAALPEAGDEARLRETLSAVAVELGVVIKSQPSKPSSTAPASLPP